MLAQSQANLWGDPSGSPRGPKALPAVAFRPLAAMPCNAGAIGSKSLATKHLRLAIVGTTKRRRHA
jgi:hypothetical protein